MALLERNNRVGNEERRAIRKEMATSQQIYRKRAQVEQRRVDTNITRLPFGNFYSSDQHFGTDASDLTVFDEHVKLVKETPGFVMTFGGDLVDGFNPAYLSTIVMHLLLPLHDQLIDFRDEYIEPLSKLGKVLGLVSNFTESHENWMMKLLAFNPYAVLTDRLNLDLIGNGGILGLHFPKGQEYLIRMFHNAPKRGSDKNPMGGPKNSEKVLEIGTAHICTPVSTST